jgi:hypothetical protein
MLCLREREREIGISWALLLLGMVEFCFLLGWVSSAYSDEGIPAADSAARGIHRVCLEFDLLNASRSPFWAGGIGEVGSVSVVVTFFTPW